MAGSSPHPLAIAILSTMVLGVVKLAAALLTGSQAVLASAADSLADAGVSGLNLWAMRHAARPADDGHPYGHGKAEALASLAQGVVLSAIVVGVGRGAVQRLLGEPTAIDTGPAIAAMLLSMAGSTGISWFLSRAAERTGSLVLRSDAVHYRMDLWTGLAVLAGLGGARFFAFPQADALASLLVCGIMGRDVVGLFRDAVGELMDRPLPAEEHAVVEAILRRYAPRVRGWSDLRTRRAGPDRFAQVRLRLPGDLTLAEAHGLAREIEEAIVEALPGVDVIVRVDVEDAPPPPP